MDTASTKTVRRSTERASDARGRCWPESARHYSVAAGHRDEAEALLTVMENSTAGQSRLLPEQVWDAADIPALELFRGKPTGSACPLVWAHSEYIKLRRSIRDGKIFDQPPQTVQRYLVEKPVRQIFGWRFNNKPRTIPRDKTLRIVMLSPAWCIGAWITGRRRTIAKRTTPDSGSTHSICRRLRCRWEDRRCLLSSGPGEPLGGDGLSE